MCGKNLSDRERKIIEEGSPPRVREERLNIQKFDNERRITPACAGRTKMETVQTISNEDHPRVCGKNLMPTQGMNVIIGSPPRVREELAFDCKVLKSNGITPACAGRTNGYDTKKQLTRDHPRVCGKNDSKSSLQSSKKGSPPRVREELV